MKNIGLLALVLLASGGVPDQGRSLGLVRLNCPTYPHLARLANVQGDVQLRARVSIEGKLLTVKVLSGAPVLAEYSRENLLTWEVTPVGEEAELDFVFSYRLRAPSEYYDPPPTVVLESVTHVTITSSLPLPSGGPELLKRKKCNRPANPCREDCGRAWIAEVGDIQGGGSGAGGRVT